MYRRALTRGIAAAIEHEKHLRFLKCATVVDVGANRGQFGLVARKLYPQARLYFFEPLPEIADVLESLFRDDLRTQVQRFAVGDKSGNELINIAGRDDSSSLLTVTDLQVSLHPKTAIQRQNKVEVRRLDELLMKEDIASPALLKLDVQGYELSALKGCGSLIDSFDWVYAECSFQELYAGQALAHEIISYLSTKGFILHGVFNISYDENGLSIDGDCLFKKEHS